MIVYGRLASLIWEREMAGVSVLEWEPRPVMESISISVDIEVHLVPVILVSAVVVGRVLLVVVDRLHVRLILSVTISVYSSIIEKLPVTIFLIFLRAESNPVPSNPPGDDSKVDLPISDLPETLILACPRIAVGWVVVTIVVEGIVAGRPRACSWHIGRRQRSGINRNAWA